MKDVDNTSLRLRKSIHFFEFKLFCGPLWGLLVQLSENVKKKKTDIWKKMLA